MAAKQNGGGNKARNLPLLASQHVKVKEAPAVPDGPSGDGLAAYGHARLLAQVESMSELQLENTLERLKTRLELRCFVLC